MVRELPGTPGLGFNGSGGGCLAGSEESHLSRIAIRFDDGRTVLF